MNLGTLFTLFSIFKKEKKTKMGYFSYILMFVTVLKIPGVFNYYLVFFFLHF